MAFIFLPNEVVLIKSGSFLKYLFISDIPPSIALMFALSAALESFVTAFSLAALFLDLCILAALGSATVLKSLFNLLFKAVSASAFVLKYFTPINSLGIFVVFPCGVANTILYLASLGIFLCFLSYVVISLTTLLIFLSAFFSYYLGLVGVSSFLGIVLTILFALAFVSILPITP